MDSAVRTAEHRARIEERRRGLREGFATVLAGEPHFIWEVGCGHGHFLTAYAAVHPDQLCIGIDIESDRIKRARRKRDRARLSNLHFIHADAHDFLAAMPPEARFAAVYILFPDPWPKTRHHKHRLVQPDFLARVAAGAAPGARLYFRTDYQPYFTEARFAVGASDAWKLVDEDWPFESPTVFQQRAPAHFSFVAAVRTAPRS